ncbi:MAG: hypothetical protein LM600_00935 [Thaumarchaeota archaeon]|nr:hypothetical protein [Nitrososphaerota archaeon]
MSVIMVSPDELIREVKPWEPSSWRYFINEYVVPLKVLGEVVVKQFAGDPSTEVVRALVGPANHVIEIAKKVIGDINEEFEAPSDPIECLRLLIEKSANTFLGVDEGGKYTLIAWTLRKLTKEYLFEALYPTLKDDEKRKATFNILGVRELFKPPVKSPIAENLTIIGYPDYATFGRVEEWGDYITLRILPVQERTLGGALSRLVDGIVAVLARPGILSGIEVSADVVKVYLDRSPSVPPELPRYCIMELPWKAGYKHLGEHVPWKYDSAWAIKGFSLKCASRIYSDSEDLIHMETDFLSFTRLIMPSLVVGRVELLLSADGRVLMVLVRTL